MDGIYHMTVEMKGPIVIDGVYSVKATYEDLTVMTSLEFNSN